MIALVAAWLVQASQTPAQAPMDPAAHVIVPTTGPVLSRKYGLGDPISLKMTAVNQGHKRTIRYSAEANGTVKADAAGHFYEDLGWSNLVVDKRKWDLPPDSASFREIVSLSPDFTPPFPDLSKVAPMLIGPITDLLTFYVDLRLAMGISGLSRAGDHVYIPYGKPSSWADGQIVTVGEDAIDFDVTLKSIDKKRDRATIIVKHVPPPDLKLNLPVDWMQARIGDAPNNWVEVTKLHTGKYLAAVGKETFDVEIHVRLSDGSIISASQENTVDVFERECADSRLSDESKGVHYKIRRHIDIVESDR